MYERNIRETSGLIYRHNKWLGEEAVNLIASEGLISDTAWKSIASARHIHGMYAEGHPGSRYYKGLVYIDPIEEKAEDAAKKLFDCRYADVRPISGNMANDCVFGRLVKSRDLVVANSVPAGGHISHNEFGSIGYYTNNIIHFPLEGGSNGKDGYRIDVEKTRDWIHDYKPGLVVFGKSLFLFPEPVEELREVCKETGTTIVYDAAHVGGLIAGKRFQDPLGEGADIMNMSTHKTLPGPERGLILSNTADTRVWEVIDRSVFPGKHSSHHTYTLPALAVTLYEMLEFGEPYAGQMISNAKTLAKELYRHGFDVQAKEHGFTKSHQVAIDVTKYGGGREVSDRLEDNNIITSKSLLPYDRREMSHNPSGIRLGTPWMTRYGMKEDEMECMADFIRDCVIKNKHVKDEVVRFRRDFQDIHYSFDEKRLYENPIMPSF